SCRGNTYECAGTCSPHRRAGVSCNYWAVGRGAVCSVAGTDAWSGFRLQQVFRRILHSVLVHRPSESHSRFGFHGNRQRAVHFVLRRNVRSLRCRARDGGLFCALPPVARTVTRCGYLGSSTSGKPFLGLPITMTFVLELAASFSVASIPFHSSS